MTKIGRVATWRRDKGFGFIQSLATEDARANDIFAHISCVMDGWKFLVEGQIVEFDVVIDPRKNQPRAMNIRVRESAPAPTAATANSAINSVNGEKNGDTDTTTKS